MATSDSASVPVSREGIAAARQQHHLSASDFVSLTRPLQLLTDCLTQLERDCRGAGEETLFIWDWEMVHEAIDPYSTSAVFSGVLWYGLGVLDSLGSDMRRPRVVYPEGTRRELLWHLVNVAKKYQRHIRHASRADAPQSVTGIEHFGDRADWKDVLARLLDVVKLDESIDRLLLLLTKYAEPMPITLAGLPKAVVTSYRDSLSRERTDKDARRRNEADALNLASADFLAKELKVRSVGLITATTAVHRVGQEQSRDPFYFALDLQMRRRYPNRDDRKTVLREMLSTLYNVLAKIGTVESLESRSPQSHIGRAEITALLDNLPRLGDDAVLREIADVAIRGAQAIDNSRIQSQESVASLVEEYGEYLSLPRLTFKIQRVLGLLGMEQPSAEEMQLDWETKWQQNGARRVELVGRGRSTFIEAEVSRDIVVLRWKTEVSIDDFLMAIDELWSASYSGQEVSVRAVPFAPSRGPAKMFTSTSTRPAHVLKVLRAVGPNRVALLRLMIGQWSFWYDASEQLSRHRLAVRAGTTWAVVSLPPHLKRDKAISQFFAATSADWLFETVFESAIGALDAFHEEIHDQG